MSTASPTDTAPPRRRGPPRRITVSRVIGLSPHMARITFIGDDLSSFEWRGPAGHLKLIVPGEGEHAVAVPEPDGPRPTRIRTYTPRRFDPVARELEIDFVLHGHGPAGQWATRAAIGDQLVMIGPAPGYAIDTEAQAFLLIGDDSALPALETILDALPASAKPNTQVLIEVVDDGERRPLPGAGAAKLHWLPRGDDPRQAGRALEAGLRTIPGLKGFDGRVYVACEAGAMRRIRSLLTGELGIAANRIVNRGYWLLDTPNHPDHDYGDDA